MMRSRLWGMAGQLAARRLEIGTRADTAGVLVVVGP
jgi:hypothetical protein